jgi:ATP synthase protein I
MSPPEETRDEAIRRLEQRAGALEARTTQTPRDEHGSNAAGYGYRLLGVLMGGVFVGLGFGFAIDWVAGTGPWGTIIGVLAGFAVSIWMAVRSARMMSAEFAKTWGPPKDLDPDDDADD